MRSITSYVTEKMNYLRATNHRSHSSARLVGKGFVLNMGSVVMEEWYDVSELVLVRDFATEVMGSPSLLCPIRQSSTKLHQRTERHTLLVGSCLIADLSVRNVLSCTAAGFSGSGGTRGVWKSSRSDSESDTPGIAWKSKTMSPCRLV